MSIAADLRLHQEADPETGLFFKAVHQFTLRTLVQFFKWDREEMGYPCIGVGPLEGERTGEFTPMNSLRLPNVITLDAFKMNTGLDVCEVIAHELVHLWEHTLEYDLTGNAHNESFHNRMADYGIATKGQTGKHVGYMGEVWEGWMEENLDLGLQRFTLGEPL